MDDMSELFDVEVEVEEQHQRKGAFVWFRGKFSGAKAFAVGLGAIVALSAPIALFAIRNSSPAASVDSTALVDDNVTTTSGVEESTSSSVPTTGKKSSSNEKRELVLPTRGVAIGTTTATTTTTTTIATNESSTSTVAPPAPPIVLTPPTTIAAGSVVRTLAFGVTTPALKSYGDVAFTVSLATPSVGGGEVTYSTSNTAVCVVDALSGEVSVVGAGGCEISATVPVNGIYASATTSTNISVTVNKASLIITASSASVAFSPRRYEVTAAYTGFVNGEDSSVFTSIPRCVVVKPSDYETSSNDRRTYATSCNGATALNYDISYVGGVLSISKRK